MEEEDGSGMASALTDGLARQDAPALGPLREDMERMGTVSIIFVF